MNMATMKEELKSVKYYYSKKEHFDKMENVIDVSAIKAMVNKYNKAIVGADPQLLDLYHALYVEGHSQVELALEWNLICTPIVGQQGGAYFYVK